MQEIQIRKCPEKFKFHLRETTASCRSVAFSGAWETDGRRRKVSFVASVYVGIRRRLCLLDSECLFTSQNTRSSQTYKRRTRGMQAPTFPTEKNSRKNRWLLLLPFPEDAFSRFPLPFSVKLNASPFFPIELWVGSHILILLRTRKEDCINHVWGAVILGGRGRRWGIRQNSTEKTPTKTPTYKSAIRSFRDPLCCDLLFVCDLQNVPLKISFRPLLWLLPHPPLSIFALMDRFFFFKNRSFVAAAAA